MNLYEPATLKRFLAKHGLTAAKGLGQHFLCSGPVVSKIVASLSGCEGVLEIGPGPGVLTGPISETAKMIALELDPTMIAALSESAPRADVRQVDALEADLPALLGELPTPRGVVSNLPYYITAPLLTRITEARRSYKLAVLMMQKEVAQRVTAPAGSSSRGSLSVYLQAHHTIEVLADVPAGAFLPPPKVESRVLIFRPSGAEHPPELFSLVRKGFVQPRKTLANNLIAGYAVPRDKAMEWLEAAGLGEKARPQELTLEQWRALANGLG